MRFRTVSVEYEPSTLEDGLRTSAEFENALLVVMGYEERSASMPYLAVDPFWYELRSDPRYADLLRRTGLPQ